MASVKFYGTKSVRNGNIQLDRKDKTGFCNRWMK